MNLSEIELEDLDLSDPAIQQALKVLQHDQTYNARLKWFFDNAYPWQKKAISLTSNHKVTGLLCGNQMGKSETACAILACHLIGVYPDWWEGERFDEPPTIMTAGVDSNHNKNVLQARLFGTNNKRMKDDLGTGMIPRDSIIWESLVSVRGDDIASCKFNHSSGGKSELIFRAYSMGREAAQGVPANVIMIDEQPNDEFWKEALTRTRATGGHVICSFTPLEGMTGLVENLLDLPGDDEAEEDRYGPKVRTDGVWAMVRASWGDAPHILKQDPNAIENARRDYSYDYEARVFGMPVAGAGRIYPHHIGDITFDPENILINDDWVSLLAIDFGWSNSDPSAIVKACWDEYNDIIYITEEWKGNTPTDKQLVRQINYIDPNLPVAWPRDGNKAYDWKGGGTVADKLRNEYQVNLLRDPFENPDRGSGRNNHLAPGFQEINSRFTEKKLKISMSCKELIKEIESYSYGKNIQGQTTGKPADRQHDHLCDAFRYAVMTIIQGYGEKPYKQQFEDFDDDFDFNII